MNESCWEGYKQVGMKKKGNRTVPNCVKKNKFSFAEWLNENKGQTYYHGSDKELPVGTVLTGRQDEYESAWGHQDWYKILEAHRPPHMLSHKESVFMCDNPDDLDAAGGGTEYMFELQPIGRVEKHDMNWTNEISMLVEDPVENEEKIIEAANNYWNGIPHVNESLWEYLTPSAKILKVEPY
jgi:hypothetical protein